MKTIFLLRHAKSDWGNPALKDHERSLNERGQEAAPRMAEYIKSKRYKPDIVLCSAARRTVETYDLVKSALGDAPVKFEESLYLAEMRNLIERINWLDDALTSVLMIGHNPGLEQLANVLTRSPEKEDEEKLHKRMRDKFSTASFVVIKMPVDAWRDVKPGIGKLKDFMRPKDL
jgi:phosphohistidine phosphatase